MKLTRPVRRTTSASRIMSAVPETSAEAMNIGAMIAEYQNPREICRPKIQAVIECSRIAAGRPTAASTPLRRSSRRSHAAPVPVPSASGLPARARSERVYTHT